jgi:selenocysteine lyase/cysteine desulfurase
VTSHRDDNLRASFHFYNDETDVESLITAMKDLRDAFMP